MTLREQMIADVQDVFLAEDAFGTASAEYITYRPTYSGNTGPRSIRAMVDRGPPDAPSEAPNVLAPMVTIKVANHPTRGIDSGTLDTGGDTVELEIWPGQGLQQLRVRKRLPYDNAMLKLECG